MPDKLSIYILGDYRQGAADGLAEFSYQNVLLLKDTFFFQFVEFDLQQGTEYYHSELRDEIRIHRFGTKNLKQFQLSGLFRSWVKDLPKKNTVFHLNHIYNLNNYLVARVLHKEKLLYLITPHDSYVYCQFYKKNKPFIKRIFRDIFVYIFDKYVLDKASVVHALTEQCPPCLRKLTGSRIMVVGNQVSDMNLTFDSSAIKSQVCYIGRFSIFQKGIDLALKAFGLFKEGNAEREEIKFIMVGPADAQAEIVRQQLCQDLNLQIGKDVMFPGKVSESERNKILTESKVYMQLSRYEGFGLSIAQALCCYKPVITYRRVPISDKITKYNAGYVVNSPEEAAGALDAVFALSPAEYIQMAMNARHCYEQEFHPAVVRPQLIRLYEEAAGTK